GGVAAESAASDINARAEIVGWSTLLASSERQAVIWKSGEIANINNLLAAGSGWVLREATAINDLGQIVGVGVHDGQTRAFLLSPTRNGTPTPLTKTATPTASACQPVVPTADVCYPNLPGPLLVFEGTENAVDAFGTLFVRYLLTVSNRSLFPNALFAPAPELPPCGFNPTSSRTWVDIFNESGLRIYGFCALTSAEDLNNIWFGVLPGAVPPSAVYITLTDRLFNIAYTSNLVSLAAAGTPTPTATRTPTPRSIPTPTPTQPVHTVTPVPNGGRLTGGGVILASNGIRVSSAVNLHCVATDGPNTLQITWGSG